MKSLIAALGAAAGVVTAIIGLVRGMGTIVGWGPTESFAEALWAAVPIGGYVYLGLAVLTIPFQVKRPKQWESRRDVLAAIGYPTLVLFFAYRGFLADDEELLRTLGLVGLGIVFATGVAVAVGWHRAKLEARRTQFEREHRECPDCKEYVKAAARVCRYCGHRFKPPPAAAG